jgi:hypothetical protein
MEKISVKKVWVRSDAWRGYYKPVNAVCGANNTENWDDSPCPEKVCLSELSRARKVLRSNNIPSKRVWCQSSNVFCLHGYLVVPESQVVRAKELIKPLTENTRLLYVA